MRWRGRGPLRRRRLGSGLLFGERGRVEEVAQVARALTGLLGRRPAGELQPGDPESLSRAALTARVIAAHAPVPWPHAMMRQLDLDDPAFLPVLGLHPVLVARERTRLGLSELRPVAHVDPYGWIAVSKGPSVAVWFGDESFASPVGRRPDEHGRLDLETGQGRGEQGLGLTTWCRRGDLLLELHHWPVMLESAPAWVIQVRLSTELQGPRQARLGLAIRPAGREGSAPIFHLERGPQGVWKADGQPILASSHRPDALLRGTHALGDPWPAFAEGALGHQPAPGSVLELRCPAGQAAATEVFKGVLDRDQPLEVYALFSPPPQAPGALARTTASSLRRGALADRRGLLDAGAGLVLERHQVVFEAARDRLLLEPVGGGLPACLGAVALSRLGFVRRAGERLGRWLDAVSRTGNTPRGEAEDPAVLAWATAEHVRWSGEVGWLKTHLVSWKRLLERLAEEPPQPGGRPLFGPDGSLAWTATWRCAALLSSASVLRNHDSDHARWALAGGQAREELPGLLGPAPWSAHPDRPPDGSSSGLLAAAWLGLLPPDHEAVRTTADHLRLSHWHGGGVHWQGGTHVAGTALLVGVAALVDPAMDPLRIVGELASPTGALPTARHPTRGALGRGDDYLSAALFALLSLDCVRVAGGRLTLRRGIVEARSLPTPWGRIDVVSGPHGERELRGRWRTKAPPIEIEP